MCVSVCWAAARAGRKETSVASALKSRLKTYIKHGGKEWVALTDDAAVLNQRLDLLDVLLQPSCNLP